MCLSDELRFSIVTKTCFVLFNKLVACFDYGFAFSIGFCGRNVIFWVEIFAKQMSVDFCVLNCLTYSFSHSFKDFFLNHAQKNQQNVAETSVPGSSEAADVNGFLFFKK